MPGVLSGLVIMINYVLLALNMPTAWFSKYFFTLSITVKFINKHTNLTAINFAWGQDVVSNSVVLV